MTLTDPFVARWDQNDAAPWEMLAMGDRTGGSVIVWMPREVPHVFANLGDEPVWSFGTIIPSGIEGMFKEQADYFADLQGPPDPERIKAIGEKNGVRNLGPPLEVT